MRSFSMKTIEDINNKIRKKKAVVLTASEVKKLAGSNSSEEVAKKVDVVTTATFSPMCSTGVFLNLGHTDPPMKMQKVFLDDVQAYGGIAAVDVYLGAAESSRTHPNRGGAHVICKLIRGEEVMVEAEGRPSDCYPGNSVKRKVRLDQINQAYFFNPRNCYQNYNAATNSSGKEMKTYMGRLRPEFGNVTYAGAGEISPLLNDPELRTIGIGTSVFFCGANGYIAWEGTQFNGRQSRDESTGLPLGPAANLAVIADMRQVDSRFIKPVIIPGYGISIAISIGVAIPILDDDIARRVLIRNRDIKTSLIDYATDERISRVNYHDLFSGNVSVRGKTIRTSTISRNRIAQEITVILKDKVLAGNFPIISPLRSLPIHGVLKKFPEE